jgi:hypothetical protein
MIKFNSFRGVVTGISDFFIQSGEADGCFKLMTVDNGLGSIVNFVVSPTTYFVNQETVAVGDRVTGYYDVNTPVVMIYPPQYQALIMVKDNPYYSVKVDYFNNQLLSSDGELKLNLSPNTSIILTNHQPFTKYPGDRNLVVIYGFNTMSIPAQTTPYQIIVWC